MDDIKFRELQYVMLSVMKDIHEVCVKNNLRYYLIGGSALGAVRHGGFIPWDVDIDIAMPRKDYDLFVTNYSSQLKPCHECVSYLTRETYSPPHALVLLKGSKVIDRSGQRQTNLRPSEVFVDILPLDICPENESDREWQEKELLKIKKAKYNKASWVFEKDGWMRRFAKFLVRSSYSCVTWRQLNERQNSIMTKYNSTSKSGLWCSMVSHYSYKKLTMPDTMFGKPTSIKFEDTELFVPEHVVEYLTQLFGDYMKLPSMETQIKQRNVFVDANWK